MSIVRGRTFFADNGVIYSFVIFFDGALPLSLAAVDALAPPTFAITSQNASSTSITTPLSWNVCSRCLRRRK